MFNKDHTPFAENTPDVEESQNAYDPSSNPVLLPEHDNPQSKPIIRKQDKRVTGRWVNRDQTRFRKTDKEIMEKKKKNCHAWSVD